MTFTRSLRSPHFVLSFALSLAAVSCGGSSSTDTTPPGDDGATGADSTGDETGATDGDTTSDSSGGSDTSTSGDSTGGSDTPAGDTPAGNKIKHVWLILEENHDWRDIKGSSHAPYINSLLTTGAHAENYFNPPKNHPSEPNYIWIESGSNLGITNDSDPSANHQSTKDHLVTKLQSAGVVWRSWQDSMPDPAKCPLSTSGLYAPKHNPMVFFDDVTDTNSPTSANCIEHVRPFTELDTKLTAGTVEARFNFISPDLCNDMHGATACLGQDLIRKGDDWLKALVPKIQATKEYKDSGAIIITWDEGEGDDGPIGMIVLSPFAKVGYSNTIKYDHSSLLRTLQEIYGVTPFLRNAATATDLSDLFTSFP